MKRIEDFAILFLQWERPSRLSSEIVGGSVDIDHVLQYRYQIFVYCWHRRPFSYCFLRARLLFFCYGCPLFKKKRKVLKNLQMAQVSPLSWRAFVGAPQLVQLVRAVSASTVPCTVHFKFSSATKCLVPVWGFMGQKTSLRRGLLVVLCKSNSHPLRGFYEPVSFQDFRLQHHPETGTVESVSQRAQATCLLGEFPYVSCFKL